MKGVLRRPLALVSISIPLLVLAAFVAEPALAAGLGPAAEAAPAAQAPASGGNDFVAWVSAHLSGPALKIGGALLFFIVGWVAAKSLSYGVFTLLSKTELDNKLAERLGINLLIKEGRKSEDGGALERFIAQVVYWLLMLLVLVGVLQIAGFTQVAEPLAGLVDTVVQALPRVAKAGLILIVAYVAGRILKLVISGSLDRLGVDTRFAQLTESKEDDVAGSPASFSQVTGTVVFWLLIVFGLAGALEALEIEPLAAPLRNAIDRVVGLLPSLGVSIVIVAVGYALGRILRVLVRNVLQGLGFDRLVARVGLEKLTGSSSASDLIGLALMVFVMLQATIAALNELGLETLAGPLTGMVARFWNMLPALAASVLIVAVGVFVGGLLRKLVGAALRNLGFDRLMARLGFEKISDREDHLGEFSEMLAFAVQVGVVLLAVAQALDNLALDTWSTYVNNFLSYMLKNVAVALAIVLVGFVIGGYVRDLIVARQPDEAEGSKWIGEFARYVVLVFAFTMAVAHLDVAENFVLMTFGLLFGALCLAMALAFGLGSRDVAGDIVKRRYEAARNKMSASRPSTGGFGKSPMGGVKPPSAGSGTPPST
ncbi:mechanosensitive ion channel [Paraliomyxa miuraensis]|uniref:mechanosensitive ion channel n=1 Tax=Paraliomyxa miuraensis TaxID=376150 RepID=UPI00224F8A62|nr:mechanosensitive ion channel [Paraliomyxa miuraensis]MCX4245215.1 mechanosensitive ion channel [Paraliomyxa miuraensis]